MLEVRRLALLLTAGICVLACPAEATEWKLGADLSGGPAAASTQLLWAAVGGPAIGSSASSSYRLEIGFLQAGSSAT